MNENVVSIDDLVLCCEAFRAALKHGTDNEGYGPLISDNTEEWIISEKLPPLQYCPWCGTKVATVEEVSQGREIIEPIG